MTESDHRHCGACMSDKTSGVPGHLCHAGHFHASAFSADHCRARQTHPVAPADDLWPTRSWSVA